MSTLVGVVGKSGFGKSTAVFPYKQGDIEIKGLDPKETFFINVKGQPLNFRNWKEHYVEGTNYLAVHDAKDIKKALIGISQQLPNIKNIVIDDAQYIMSFRYIADADKKGYDKFTKMAKDQIDILTTANALREDLMVFYITHSDISDDGDYKIKTIGKMIDNAVTLEGLFNIILYADARTSGKKTSYKFVTNKTGMYTGKSPMGMFELEIPNDLGYVRDEILNYYG